MEPDPKRPVRRHPNHRVVERRRGPTVVHLTVCTKSRRPLLASAMVHERLRTVWAGATAWMVGRYVVMPDHVHLLAALGTPELPLTNWASFWKRAFTRAHGEAIWQDDYWDTTLRDVKHADEKCEYVRNNPVRAGLVVTPEEWPWQGELNLIEW